MKATEKKAIVIGSIADLKATVTPETTVFIDERGKSPNGLATMFKALIVVDGEIVNISETVGNACCLRVTKRGEVIVKGMLSDLASVLKSAISSVVFGNPDSLITKQL